MHLLRRSEGENAKLLILADPTIYVQRLFLATTTTTGTRLLRVINIRGNLFFLNQAGLYVIYDVIKEWMKEGVS